jgi:hypothetical protein
MLNPSAINEIKSWSHQWHEIEPGLVEHTPTRLRVAFVHETNSTISACVTEDSAQAFIEHPSVSGLTDDQVTDLATVLCQIAVRWHNARK